MGDDRDGVPDSFDIKDFSGFYDHRAPGDPRGSFKVSIDNEVRRREVLRGIMVDFSREIHKAMRLKSVDSAEAESIRRKWRVGDYVIACRNFVGFPGWQHLLYAYPESFGEPGWSNRETGELDENNWYYVPGGTATIFAPKPAERLRILAAIAADFEGESR